MTIQVTDLSLALGSKHAIGRPVRGVNLSVGGDEIVGIVGESGSGKTLTALAIMGLLPEGVRIERGSITLNGADLLQRTERELSTLRGSTVSMVFQNYRASLNPVFTVSQQIRPLIARAERISRRTAHGRVVSVLATAGLKDPERVARSYPHELSGGMAQRVAIALALACRPKVLIADEPGTGLDAIVRAEVMESMRTAVRREVGCAIIISHDMALISQLCDRIVVMYGGEVMEMGETRMLLEAPLHPYTQALLSVSRIPSPGDPYPTIPGTIPDVFTQTAGCPFCPRCISRMAVCETVPLHDVVRSGRVVRCHLYPEADHADNR